MTIRIYSTYKTVSKPWGGANNFLRALLAGCDASKEFSVVENPEDGFDILFMNQNGAGPAQNSRTISSAEIDRLRALSPDAKLIVRAINLRRHAYYNGILKYIVSRGFIKDCHTLSLLHRADHVIFQSQYQKDFFVKFGYKGSKNSIIHNGASDSFSTEKVLKPLPLSPKAPLILLSSSVATRSSKRHDIIAALSQVPNVKIYHAGRWPENLPHHNVELLGILNHKKLVKYMKNSHYFLHPAINDPCPNSVIEALALGIPVIYNPAEGSSAELVSTYGEAINEADLASTIAKARKNYKQVTQNLSKARANFSIARAAEDYMDVFKKILK